MNADRAVYLLDEQAVNGKTWEVPELIMRKRYGVICYKLINVRMSVEEGKANREEVCVKEIVCSLVKISMYS